MRVIGDIKCVLTMKGYRNSINEEQHEAFLQTLLLYQHSEHQNILENHSDLQDTFKKGQWMDLHNESLESYIHHQN